MTKPKRPETRQDRKAVTKAVSLLLWHISSDGARRFVDLCREEGLIWKCPNCGEAAFPASDLCESCGDPAWV